jgi:peptide chain release factor 1
MGTSANSMIQQLERVVVRFDEVNELLADPAVLKDTNRLKTLGREHSELSEIVEAYKKYQQTINGIEEAKTIQAEDPDEEMIAVAEEELAELLPVKESMEEKLRELLIPKDPNDQRNVIMEIRAGTGGEEAALFAADLYRMYSRHAERHQWKVEELSLSPSDVGGFREIIFSVSGTDVYGALRFEAGVHRVQRVPATEASGRIHTSAASVAVMPEAEEVDIRIDPKELQIDVYRSSGPGGQSVNTTDSAVRITHLPTGLVVTCQDEKSQHKNKAKALKVLSARLLAQKQEEENAKIAASRREMVGSGDRSAKIRTYNYPQNRVSDHRINLTLYKLEAIMDGECDELIEQMQIADRTAKMEQGLAEQ